LKTKINLHYKQRFSSCSAQNTMFPPPTARQPLVGQGLLIIEASRPHA